MAKESVEAKKTRALRIIGVLKKTYPTAHCALDHRNAFELLVATILSAQCTDARVNMVTPVLFKKYPTAEALAKSSKGDVEKIIQSTGFFRAKAKSIRATAADIVEKHGGKVPQSMEELTELRGVGRKTANVVLGNAFGQNVGVVVDTHVSRLSQRLGLTGNTDPVKIEQDLIKLVPQEEWTLLSHLLIFHGRQICVARKPRCEACPVLADCPTGQKLVAEAKKGKPARG
ncbi:MAG: endonuclease III [Phycisphaerae bacterium]